MTRYRYDWDVFITQDLLGEIHTISRLDPDDSLEALKPFIFSMLHSTGGFPVADKQYNVNECTQIARGLLTEGFRHALKTIGISTQRTGYQCVEHDTCDHVVCATMLNINIASEQELEALPGIGIVLAKRIVLERIQNGIFSTWHELQERVDGIGETIVNDISSSVEMADPDPNQNYFHLPADFEESLKLLVFLTSYSGSNYEKLDNALSYAATVCSTNPHPSSLERRVRDRDDSFSLMDMDFDNVDMIKPLINSDYYYHLQTLFSNASHTIKVCMFHIAFPSESHPTRVLLDKLIEKNQQGVEVQVLLDKDRPSDPYRSTVINQFAKDYLEENGVTVRFDPVDKLLHSKMVIIDDNYVVIGSHNWSAGSYFHVDELSLLLNSPELALKYKQRFDGLWALSA